jgi:hypothetical protein
MTEGKEEPEEGLICYALEQDIHFLLSSNTSVGALGPASPRWNHITLCPGFLAGDSRLCYLLLYDLLSCSLPIALFLHI